MRSHPAVVVDGVSKSFRVPHHRVDTLKERVLHPIRSASAERFNALTDVSFEVRTGEFFGIVGRNGSGKSTLLKALAGIYSVDRGEILIAGRLSTFIELGVGFNPELAARDNVIMNGIMLGLTPSQARERFERVIEFAELEDFTELKLKNYSSGMHVRLAFSVMVQVDADVLLIDEVLAVGDAAFQRKCFDVFDRLRDEQRTILFVSHDMAAVNRYCDRALLLDSGRARALGDPLEVSRRYLDANFERGRESAGEMEAAGGKRLSDGGASIADAWTESSAGQRKAYFHQGEECVFKARVEFAEAIDDPSFSVAFVNDQHQNQFVAATDVDRVKTGGYQPGDVAEVALRFENAFAPGRYQVSMLVSRGSSGLEVLDRWEFMFSVVVAGTAAAGGLVDLPHDLEVVRVVPSAAETAG